MQFIKPSYKILSKIDGSLILLNLEYAGRTCYKSEDKITTDSAKEFVAMLLRRGHESVLEHEKITIKFICDRGVSHEIVRHRIASFSQESTRYCNYSKKGITFIIPTWVDLDGEYEYAWRHAMLDSENHYNTLIEKGWKPEQARSVLPNSLKTEIVVTANLREWRLILKQRTAPGAHPQMRELMVPLWAELKQLIPVIFDVL